MTSFKQVYAVSVDSDDIRNKKPAPACLWYLGEVPLQPFTHDSTTYDTEVTIVERYAQEAMSENNFPELIAQLPSFSPTTVKRIARVEDHKEVLSALVVDYENPLPSGASVYIVYVI